MMKRLVFAIAAAAVLFQGSISHAAPTLVSSPVPANIPTASSFLCLVANKSATKSLDKVTVEIVNLVTGGVMASSGEVTIPPAQRAGASSPTVSTDAYCRVTGANGKNVSLTLMVLSPTVVLQTVTAP